MCELRHMLDTLCAEREVPDVEFFLNKRDFPMLKADLTEPYDFLYDPPGTPGRPTASCSAAGVKTVGVDEGSGGGGGGGAGGPGIRDPTPDLAGFGSGSGSGSGARGGAGDGSEGGGGEGGSGSGGVEGAPVVDPSSGPALPDWTPRKVPLARELHDKYLPICSFFVNDDFAGECMGGRILAVEVGHVYWCGVGAWLPLRPRSCGSLCPQQLCLHVSTT